MSESAQPGGVDRLIKRAGELKDGDEKIAVIEEAVRLADRSRDLKLQYQARDKLVEAAIWGGKPEKALVAYSWCLAQFDNRPDLFDEWMILWRYKWIINSICHFPQISKEQIYKMLDEMERRYKRAGYGRRVVYQYRYQTERFWGNRKEAIEHYLYAQKLSTDDLSNCVACELDTEVSFNIYSGKDEQGLSLATPILDGWRKCRAVPQRTLAYILLPLLRLGREEEARQYQRRGYAMIDNHREFLDHMSHHLLFLTLTGNLKEATRLLEKHYHWSEENTDLYDQFVFHRAAWLLLETMIEAGTDNIKLRLPDSFPLASENGRYQTSQLSEWFETRARSLASRFDERNGNDYFTRELLDMAALKELRVRE